MKSKTLKYIIFLAAISITAVLLIQFIFLRSSYDFSEKQFRESTSVALKEVAWQILLSSGNTANFDSITPVEIISGNSYLVNVEAVIDKEILKQNLVEQLKKHEIHDDFEFAIFNPEAEMMDDGTYLSSGTDETMSFFEFPTNENYTNYFAIHFPDRKSFFNAQLSIWYFFTGLLIVVILFFAYTLWVIIKQRQLSEIQKNFINNLTHELKTPISSIALSASVINDEKILESPKRLFQYARIIQDQNKRLSKNVEKVLNLASIEKSKIVLNKVEFELNSFLKESIKQFKQTDFSQNSTIKLHQTKEDIFILADQFHFSNLILNILENAVKYCEKKPNITVEIKPGNRFIDLLFTDNGIGISKDQRKKIFTKFYRVPTGNIHNVKGFGLGLDYVQKIVVAHKWKIKVDENPKGGSIFTITIYKTQ